MQHEYTPGPHARRRLVMGRWWSRRGRRLLAALAMLGALAILGCYDDLDVFGGPPPG
jgi:hypothetical protein